MRERLFLRTACLSGRCGAGSNGPPPTGAVSRTASQRNRACIRNRRRPKRCGGADSPSSNGGGGGRLSPCTQFGTRQCAEAGHRCPIPPCHGIGGAVRLSSSDKGYRASGSSVPPGLSGSGQYGNLIAHTAYIISGGYTYGFYGHPERMGEETYRQNQ